MSYDTNVAMFNKVHSEGFYSYPNSTKTNYIHFDVYCNRCESLFSITPANHKQGHGCPRCAYRDLPGGWTNKDWELMALNSNHFDSFKVYIVNCFNENKSESFIKIGKTFRSTKIRFKTIPYEYEIVKEFIFNQAEDATEFESKLKERLSEFRYEPKIKFNGRNECFSNEALEKILNE